LTAFCWKDFSGSKFLSLWTGDFFRNHYNPRNFFVSIKQSFLTPIKKIRKVTLSQTKFLGFLFNFERVEIQRTQLSWLLSLMVMMNLLLVIKRDFLFIRITSCQILWKIICETEIFNEKEGIVFGKLEWKSYCKENWFAAIRESVRIEISEMNSRMEIVKVWDL